MFGGIIMEINDLNKQIEARAKARFNKDYDNLHNAIKSNPIGCRLEINTVSFEEASDLVRSDRDSIINPYQNSPVLKDTNFNKVKEELMAVYIKEEAQILLNKIDSLSDYFTIQNQQNENQ
jgi:hypothetical protein